MQDDKFMRFRREEILQLVTFLIYPIVSVLWVFFKPIPNSKVQTIILSLFMGLCAYNLVPYQGMDIVVYYERYNILSGISFAEVPQYFNSNLGVVYLIKTIETLGLSKEFIPFVITSLSYLALFKTVHNLLGNSHAVVSSMHWRYLLLFMLLVTSFVNSAVGLRSGLSTSIFALALSYALVNKWSKFYLLCFASMIVHIYISLGVAAIVLSKLLPRLFEKITPKVLLLGPLLILSGLGVDLAVKIASLVLPPNLSEYVINSYMLNESWGYGVEINWKTKLVSLLFLSSAFYAAWFLFSLKKRLNSPIEVGICFLMIFVFLVWDFFTISERYKYLIQIATFIVILQRFFICNISQRKRFINSLPIVLFFCSSMLSTMWGVYRYKVVIIDSYSFIAYPFWFSFFNDVDINNLRFVPSS